MAVLEILTLPDERLRQVSAPVTNFDDELRAFIADLEETRLAGPAAVGIAAPQVNVFQRIADDGALYHVTQEGLTPLPVPVVDQVHTIGPGTIVAAVAVKGHGRPFMAIVENHTFGC